MTVLNSSVTIYSILPDPDAPTMYSVKGQILNSGSPVGDFVASYVDSATASTMVVGSTYAVSMTIP